jgi:Ca2+-binding RTX toxin-like protein
MIIGGTAANDILVGTDEGDSISGKGGNDTLYGGKGSDNLDGGPGADLMVGGYGDDVFWVDDVGDRAVEGANQGFDDAVYSTVSFHIQTNVENLVLRGTANINGNGNSRDNIIVGNSGANHLNGGGGTDRLEGGNGNDVYVGDLNDTFFESPGGGTDTLREDFSMADLATWYTMPDNIENLTMTGWRTSLRIDGNALDNLIRGSSGPEELRGMDGNDHLFGGAGDDYIF